MEQLSLIPATDADASRAAAQNGIAKKSRLLETPQGEYFRGRVLDAVKKIAHDQPTLTVDDVWKQVNVPPEFSDALGPLLIEASHKGYITLSDAYRKSERPTRHGAPLRVWASNLYGEN